MDPNAALTLHHEWQPGQGAGSIIESWVPSRQDIVALCPEPEIVGYEVLPLPHRPTVCVARRGPWKAILSLDVSDDRREWFHVSVSCGKQHRPVLPTWNHLCAARRALFQPDVVVVQVMPPADEWFSAANVLHLWQRRGEDRLVPDLRKGGAL